MLYHDMRSQVSEVASERSWAKFSAFTVALGDEALGDFETDADTGTLRLSRPGGSRYTGRLLGFPLLGDAVDDLFQVR